MTIAIQHSSTGGVANIPYITWTTLGSPNLSADVNCFLVSVRYKLMAGLGRSYHYVYSARLGTQNLQLIGRRWSGWVSISGAWEVVSELWGVMNPPTGIQDLQLLADGYSPYWPDDVVYCAAGFSGVGGFFGQTYGTQENTNLDIESYIRPGSVVVTSYGCYNAPSSLMTNTTEIIRDSTNRCSIAWHTTGAVNWASPELHQVCNVVEVVPASVSRRDWSPVAWGGRNITTTGPLIAPDAYVISVGYLSEVSTSEVATITADGHAFIKCGRATPHLWSYGGPGGEPVDYYSCLEQWINYDTNWTTTPPTFDITWGANPPSIYGYAYIVVGFVISSLQTPAYEGFNSSSTSYTPESTLTTSATIAGTSAFCASLAAFGYKLDESGSFYYVDPYPDSGVNDGETQFSSTYQSTFILPDGTLYLRQALTLRPPIAKATVTYDTTAYGTTAANSVAASMGIVPQLPTRGRRILKAQT